MKERTHSRRFALIVLTSVSMLAALSACSGPKRWLDSMTNDRESQRVDGPRRLPARNPQVMQQPQEALPAPRTLVQKPAAPQPEPEKVLAAKRAPTFEQSPFDYYDNAGNRVEPKEEASEESGDNFLSRIFGKNEPTAADRLRDEPRKPLLDNPYGHGQVGAPVVMMAPEPAMEEQAPLPAPVMAPMVDAPKEEPMPFVPQEKMVMPVDEQQDVPQMMVKESGADTVPPVEVSESRNKPNWFERNLGGVFSGSEEADASDTSMVPDQFDAQSNSTLSYPELSSVPPTPKQFEAVRDSKQQQMEELQADHMTAEQERANLYSEPSGQDALVPVETPAQPAMKPMAAPATDGSAVLLGHAADPAVAPAEAPQPVVVEQAVPARGEIPYEKAMTEPSMPAASGQTERKGSWWEGWNLFSSKRQNEEMTQEDSTFMPYPREGESANAPQPVAEPAPMQPLTSQQPAPVEYRQVAPVAVPEQIVSAPPVSEAVAADMEQTNTAEEMPADQYELPSPNILQRVKTLPPSRYQARERAYPQNPQPY